MIDPIADRRTRRGNNGQTTDYRHISDHEFICRTSAGQMIVRDAWVNALASIPQLADGRVRFSME
ncbi:hypothetical protein ACBJ59_34895 [Nonomuraea sp. MTCD27]|uniref:hypothetical protein n=1 Tax=Nonomuraea sp. MTCD27 TaxID=1676747 RepID=UPI0035BF6007